MPPVPSEHRVVAPSPSGPARGLTSAAAAVAVVALAWVGSYRDFEFLRMKFVRATVSAERGELRAELPTPPADRVARLPTPLALIVELDNASDRPAALTFRVGGATLCEWTVAPRAHGRADCAIARSLLQPGAALVVTGPADGWSVSQAEVASHHGRTIGVGEVLVLPRGSSAVTPVSPIVALALGALAAALVLVPSARLPLFPRILHWGVVCLSAAIVVAMILSRFVTPFVVVISPGALALLIAVSALPRAWRVALWMAGEVRRRLRGHDRARRALAAIIVAGVALAAITAVAQFVRAGRGGNDSSFIHVNKTYYDGHPLLSTRADVRQTLVIEDPGGYDGQFMYFEAFDPFIRQFADRPAVYLQFIDNPPYRYARIGYVWLIDLVSLGDWRRFPTAMLLILMISGAVCVYVLGRLAQAHGVSPLWGLLALLIPGLWQSLFNALPEALVAATVLAGYLAWQRGRMVLAAFVFACAILTRETALIGLLCLLMPMLAARQHRDAFVLSLAVVPWVLWHVYVGVTLMPAFGAAAFFGSSPVVGVPFAGLSRMFTAAATHHYFPNLPILERAGFWFPLVLVSGLVTAIACALRRPSGPAVAAVFYGLIAVSFTYTQVWAHVSNGQRASYELFVWMAIVTVTMWTSWSRPWRVGVGAFWTFSGVFTFGLSFDGEAVRASLPVFAAAVVVWVVARLTIRAERAEAARLPVQ